MGKQLPQVSLPQRIDSPRFLDRINQASLKSFAPAGRMVRMLPAGRKSAAADNKPSPVARRVIRWRKKT